MWEERKAALFGLLVLADLVALSALWWAVPAARELMVLGWPGGLWPHPASWLRPLDVDAVRRVGLVAVPVWLVAVHGLGAVQRRPSWSALATASGLALIGLVGLLYAARHPHVSRSVLLAFTVAVVPALWSTRWAVWQLGALLPGLPRGLVLVGAEEATLRALEGEDLRPFHVVARVGGGPGLVEQVERALERAPVHEVRVVGGAPVDLADLAALCAELGVSMTVDVRGSVARWSGGGEVVSLRFSPMFRPAILLKRVVDVVLAALGLVLLAPVIGAAAGWIAWHGGRPLLFSQMRVGLHGAPFRMYKLRTMVPEAEALLEELGARNETGGPTFKMHGDPRITWWGRVLRRWSIDELPQLWHVLTGEMSLVGPRPALPEEVRRYTRAQRRRLSMRPGMTCIWQVSGRSDVPFERWMEMDLAYVDRWSPALDLWLLLRTVPAVWSGHGAR
jgi:lipopolysaccharide/colanic/teichoic acid biosynthesis glycosyltransferase